MDIARHAARTVVVIVLGSAAALKLGTPHDPRVVDLPASLYYGVAVVELALAVLVLARPGRVVAYACLVSFLLLAVGGAFFEGNCGCFGAHWLVSRDERLFAVGIGGLSATAWTMLLRSVDPVRSEP